MISLIFPLSNKGVMKCDFILQSTLFDNRLYLTIDYMKGSVDCPSKGLNNNYLSMV